MQIPSLWLSSYLGATVWRCTVNRRIPRCFRNGASPSVLGIKVLGLSSDSFVYRSDQVISLVISCATTAMYRELDNLVLGLQPLDDAQVGFGDLECLGNVSMPVHPGWARSLVTVPRSRPSGRPCWPRPRAAGRRRTAAARHRRAL